AVDARTLRVLTPAVGGELGVETEKVWAVAGANVRPFNPSRNATGFSVDATAGYSLLPNLSVDVGMVWVSRSVPLRSSQTGDAHGEVSDTQLIARVGASFVLGAVGEGGGGVAPLRITVSRDGTIE